MKEINGKDTAYYALYSTRKKALIFICKSSRIGERYFVSHNRMSTGGGLLGVYARNKSALSTKKTPFNERIAVRFATEEQIKMLGDKDYILLDEDFRNEKFCENPGMFKAA